jgi:uncharacterized protein YfaS (alpha-2-macroglobulin family)
MNRLRAIRDLPPLATWLLADAYTLSGLPKIASDLIDATPSITENPSLSAISYGSLQRNQAIELMVLDRLGHSGRAATMANRLAATLDNGEPLATHTTAWVLHALGHHFRSMAGKKTLWGWQQAGSDLWLSEGQAPLTRFAIDQPAAGGELTFRNFEPLPLHLGLTATGVVNAGEAVPEQNGIGLRVSYLDRDGREISGKTGRQGDEFSIRISVSNPGERKLRHLALTLPIASGWQLQRLLDSTLEHPPQVDHQRILDDRIDLYFDLDAGEERHFAVELVNSFSGRFYRPGARIESMYRLDINAAEADGWIVISPPPGSLPIVHNNLAQRGEI